MFNWFNFIYVGLGAVLKFFSDLAGGNFLVGLIVFAVIIKVILIPFGIKQQSNAIKQARYKPREMAIRRKYAGRNDRATQQKMQNEIMEMYQKDGYNLGCLPMILQMAIILLLYQVIIHPLLYVVGVSQESVTAMTTYFKETVANGGLGFNLAGGYQEITIMKEALAIGAENFTTGFRTFCESYVADGVQPYLAGANTLVAEAGKIFSTTINFNIFGLRNFLAETPSVASLWTFPWTNLVWLVLIPLLNFAAQFFTMKLQKKLTFQPMQEMQQGQMGCMTKVMDWGFPAMTLVIAFTVPAAIGIYWLFNNLLGIVQMFILHKAMPIPKFTEEDVKAAERELKGKAEKLPKTPDGVRSNPNSLHTIDFEEEDYAVLPEYESIYDKTEEEKAEAEAEAKTKINGEEVGEADSKIGAAPLKKKSKKDKK